MKGHTKVYLYFLIHRENSEVLIWAEKVLKNLTTFLKLKVFLFCSNQVELAVSMYIVYIKKLLNKLNLTFLFSPFRSNIESIDSKMYLNGF